MVCMSENLTIVCEIRMWMHEETDERTQQKAIDIVLTETIPIQWELIVMCFLTTS